MEELYGAFIEKPKIKDYNSLWEENFIEKEKMNMDKIKIDKFLDDQGKISQLPQKQSIRVATLSYLAEKFESNRNYTEKEVNTICEDWHTFGDYFILRRELIDNGLLCREPNGSRYWKPKTDLPNKTDKEIRLNTTFHPIDFDNWDRKQYFYYFTKMLPTGFSISVEADITNTYNMMKKQNKKFFPAYLYLASKLIAEQQEFRISKLNEQLGYYEVLHPSYACFHQDDKTMSNMWTEYDPNFEVFYHNYMEDQENYADNHGILAKPDTPPQNSFMIGMLPWIKFTSYTPIPYADINNYFPVIQAGRFFDREGKIYMPLSITVHHAVADGYHVGLFLEKFKTGIADPESWV